MTILNSSGVYYYIANCENFADCTQNKSYETLEEAISKWNSFISDAASRTGE